VRRHRILLPAAAALVLAGFAAATVPFLAEARGERRAEAMLRSICAAEQTYRRGAQGYGKLDELVQAHLLEPELVPGYDVRIELAKDGHTFWARAVPEREGLRGMIVDSQGIVVYDGSGE